MPAAQYSNNNVIHPLDSCRGVRGGGITILENYVVLRKVVVTNTLRFLVSSCSIEKVSKIVSPVLVIHGTEDEVIDFSHGLAIYERCPRTVEPLWVEGAGHNDVELYGQYLERLKQFIQHELVTN